MKQTYKFDRSKSGMLNIWKMFQEKGQNGVIKARFYVDCFSAVCHMVAVLVLTD